MRKNKYGNKKVVIDNIRFDSMKEGSRYKQLKILEKVGKIRLLDLQTKIPISVKGIKICTYKCDFKYYDEDKEMWIHEDVKGVRTAIYQLKKKLVLAVHGIEIFET